MRFATWNVRTLRTGSLNTHGSSDCAQDLRKTASVNVELKRLNVDIAALQETRIEEEGSIRESDYTFFWKGKKSSEPREYGVGFAVRNRLLNAIETPVGVSERIMVLRLNTKSGFVTLISAYAPTLNSKPETKDQFYDQLGKQCAGCTQPTECIFWVILMPVSAGIGLPGQSALVHMVLVSKTKTGNDYWSFALDTSCVLAIHSSKAN